MGFSKHIPRMEYENEGGGSDKVICNLYMQVKMVNHCM